MQQLVENDSTQTAVAAGTMMTGIGTMMSWIPTEIGLLASLLGAVLSAVLIVKNITLWRAKRRGILLDNERKEAERDIAIQKRDKLL
jgi:hypothetical protein